MHEIRVAKSTRSVFSTDPNDFIFHSRYNTFKILAEGFFLTQTAIGGSPTTTTLSIAHGRSFIPTVFAFIKYDDGYVAVPSSSRKTGATIWCDIGVDATNIYFKFVNFGANTVLDIKYYIFESPLT